TYSYPQTGSFNLGASEYALALNGVLYTTDSASGRVWKIDLVTRSRTVVIDYGAPNIVLTGSIARFPIAVRLGPFWIDGTNLYLIRYGAIERIDMNSGTATRLMNSPPIVLWGESQFLYFPDGRAIRKVDVTRG